MRSRTFVATVAAAILAWSSGHSLAGEATVQGPGVSSVNLEKTVGPGKRHIVIAAVEPKGGTTVDKEAFPNAALPTGKGYVLNSPNASGRWEVSAYVFMPSQIFVNQGDDVTLEYVGINGAVHPTHIEGYDVHFTTARGQVTLVQFKADKPGVFQIFCHEHLPAMRGELIVLPRT